MIGWACDWTKGIWIGAIKFSKKRVCNVQYFLKELNYSEALYTAAIRIFFCNTFEFILFRAGGYHSLVDILVATPGRLVDHINQTAGFSLKHLTYLVGILRSERTVVCKKWAVCVSYLDQ